MEQGFINLGVAGKMKKTVLMLIICFLLSQSIVLAQHKPIIERLLPVPKEGGFKMDGYFVWGGSLIKADGKYHLFASRWPTWETLGKEFVENGPVSILGLYREYSEIVHAEADDPLGPYTFKDVVVSGRGDGYWDGQMCHNPKIIKIDDEYVLFYIGRYTDRPERKVGYAVASSINGPWKRSETQILLTEDANNPAPYVNKDGSVLLSFRDRHLANFIVKAEAYDGDYEFLAGNITPGKAFEDASIFYKDNVYHMVMEDNRGLFTGHVRHGAHLVSEDAITWKVFDPVHIYTHTVQWNDGTETTFDRRERPELVNLDNPPERKYDGEPTHLLTGAQIGMTSWCIIQEIAKE